MVSKLHVISGLPRSGSTLLCALLRQNPNFTAAMTSPVASLCSNLHQKMCGGEFGVFFDDTRRQVMLKGVFESYYAHCKTDQVIFDTNRSWTGRTALLGQLYPQSKIICCVRDVNWIIDSIECMLNKNPLQLSKMFNFQTGQSIYSRVEMLMNSETGLIGQAWSNLREAWFGNNASRLIVIPYEKLTSEPIDVLRKLYLELGEPYFQHDINNVIYDEPDYDAHIGMPGLHTVRSTVKSQQRLPCIPPDIFSKFELSSFWSRHEMNIRNVTIL